MKLKNKRATVMENEIVHLFKVRLGMRCSKCEMDEDPPRPRVDSFRYQIVIDDEFEKSHPPPSQVGKHYYLSRLLLEGFIPFKNMYLLCNSCARGRTRSFKVNRPQLKSQRGWRQSLIKRLRYRLGHYCHRCESEDAVLQPDSELRLKIYVRHRMAEDLSKYGNNTTSIYSHLLKGILPMDRVSLMCADCIYETRQEEKEGK